MVRVVVGRLGRPHGIRGEVTVEIRTDEPELRYAPGSSLYVEGSSKVLTVESGRVHSGVLLLKVEGIDDRNGAESLRGMIVESDVDELELPEDEDEFYDRQLVGITAYQNGEAVGVVTDVLHLPGQDVLSIELTDGREMLLPFIAEFVPVVDIAARRLEIEPPAGLMEEDVDAH
jgi:16S rRNA processing protein RimM